MNYFNQSQDDVLTALNSSRENGLTDAQVSESRKKHGENIITEEKPKSIFMVFFGTIR